MTAPQPRFTPGVFIALILTIFIATALPRALGFLPGLIGLVSLLLWPLFFHDRKPYAWLALRPVLFPALVLLALSTLSALWAINGPETLIRALKVFAILFGGACLFSLCRTLPTRDIVKLWWLLPLATALSALFMTFEYCFDYPVFRLLRDIPKETRVALSELNRASVALSLISLPATALLYCGLRSKGWTRLKSSGLSALHVLVMLPVLIMTDSQSAQLAFLLGILALALAPVGRKVLWIAAAAALVAGVMSAPWLAQYLFSLVPQSGEPIHQYASYINHTNYLPRLELWDYVSRYALQSPWLGYGMDATRYVTAFDSKQIYQPGVTLLHPHNAALQIWMEFGALGAVLTAGGMALLCKKLSDQPDQLSKRLGLAVFAGVMAVGVVGYGLWQAWWVGLLTFLAALSALTIRIIAAQKQKS